MKLLKVSDVYEYGLVAYACCDCRSADADNCGFGE